MIYVIRRFCRICYENYYAFGERRNQICAYIQISNENWNCTVQFPCFELGKYL